MFGRIFYPKQIAIELSSGVLMALLNGPLEKLLQQGNPCVDHQILLTICSYGTPLQYTEYC